MDRAHEAVPSRVEAWLAPGRSLWPRPQTVAAADKHDALPLEGQGPDGSGIGFAAAELILDKHLGPTAVEYQLAGEFEEALMDEVGPGPAAMDPVLVFAAFLSNRGGPAILLDSGSALVAGAVGAKSASQAWCQGKASAREAFPD